MPKLEIFIEGKNGNARYDENYYSKNAGITCGGCAGSIKNALEKMEGIKNVEVDINTKMVSVEHSAQISREQITSKLDDIGFPVE